jgi:Type VI secretion system (T6SS), amidase immunity protein
MGHPQNAIIVCVSSLPLLCLFCSWCLNLPIICTELDASEQLLNSALARDYRHPLSQDYKNIRFDALKCLDMYHSKALTSQVKRFVSQPDKPYRPKK